MPEKTEDRLTLAEAARRAGMTIEGIRDAIRRGKLRAEVIAVRPVYAIRPADLEAYLREAEKEPRGRPRSGEQRRRKKKST
jgi:hypothetical protein